MDPALVEEIGKIMKEIFKSNISDIRFGIYTILVVIIVQLVLKFKERNKEVKCSTMITKKNNEIEVVRRIYTRIVSVTYELNDHKKKSDDLISSINSIRKNIREDQIIIDDGIIKYMNELLDLFSIAAVDRTSRNSIREGQLLKQIKTKFKSL